MRISDISVPQIYKESWDFRFFLKWFETALSKVHYDIEHADNVLDPLKCPKELLWMLADTMGYQYDDRLPASFNRFVLLYFMSMIRNRGSKDGVTLAAEANLRQFDIQLVAGVGYEDNEGNVVPPNPILFNRLEDTSLPVNSVYVTPHVDEGYIDVIYFSDRVPIDACIEYVRPLGMYLFQNAGVRLDSKTKINVDARLTNKNDVGLSIGPTHVGHYSRDDYARLQRLTNTTQDLSQVDTSATSDDKLREGYVLDTIHEDWEDPYNRSVRVPKQELTDTRRNVWYRNAVYEGGLNDIPVQATNRDINPGYRALYSLQLCNNEHIVKSLIPSKDNPDNLKNKDQIFGLGWEPQDVNVTFPDDYVLPDIDYSMDDKGRIRPWNLRYDRDLELSASPYPENPDVYTMDDNRSEYPSPKPQINPIMHVLGDAISVDEYNNTYVLAVNPDGSYPLLREGSQITIDGVTYQTSEVQKGYLTIGGSVYKVFIAVDENGQEVSILVAIDEGTEKDIVTDSIIT